ncbi:MAG: hypothetical protein CMI60_22800 [Parvibaculum sp.]|nr:hypothetical protein [Parvibaculum sp.]
MQLTKTQTALEAFKKFVIQQARTRLTKGKKNASRELYDSLKGVIGVGPNSIALDFEMEEYGIYQDKGVKGVGGVRRTTSKFNSKNNKGKMWKQKAKNSPFSFKQGNKPSVKHFKDWARMKGLNAFAVRESVYHQGIKPSLFFTKPFEQAFKKLPKELKDKFGLDIQDFLAFTLNQDRLR